MSRAGGPPRRYAIVGTGAISQIVHVPILAERRDVDLAVLADADGHKARSVAERFGVPETVAPDALFEREDIDAIVVATPNHLHEEYAIRALEAGKHVFCERPLAHDAEAVDRVLAVAKRSECVLVVGMPHRYRPEVAALRSFVGGGQLGEIYAVRGSWLTRRMPTKPTWRQDPVQAGGGVLVDLGVAALDLSFWLVGYPRIERVRCSLSTSEHDVEDAATLMAIATSGTVFTLEVSNRYFASEDRYYARVMGTEGSGSFPPFEVYRQIGGRPLDVTPRQPRPRGGENRYTNAYRRQIDHFVRAVEGQVEAPLPTEQSALLAVIRAAYRSAAEGREVTL